MRHLSLFLFAALAFFSGQRVHADTAQTGPQYAVNTADDHTDGVCGTTDCSLREAITASNTFGSNNPSATPAITFEGSVFSTRQTISISSSNLPVISSNRILTAPAAGVVLQRVASTPSSYVLFVSSGSSTFSGLTIKNSSSSTTPGASTVGIGTLGNTTIQNCTFQMGGGSTAVDIGAGTNTIRSSTLVGDSASTGILVEAGAELVQNCTITGNAAGVKRTGGVLTISNSLIVGNTSNIQGAFNDGGFNLTFGLASEAGLDPSGLQENGGPTPTIALTPGGSAIDKGNSGFSTDQRGQLRPIDFNGVPNASGGNASDIGAFEVSELPQSGTEFIVNKTDDHDDGVAGYADCTLREAINAANAYNGSHGNSGTRITFDTTLFEASRKTIVLNGSPLTPASTLILNGPTIGVIINANSLSSVFSTSGGGLTFSNLSIVNGLSGTGGGGGIANNSTGNLTLRNCTFSNNSGGGAQGGALSNAGGTVAFENCTFSGNTVGAGSGGALFNSGTITVDSCTFSGNSAATGASLWNSASGSFSSRNSLYNDSPSVLNTGTFNDGGNNLVLDSGSGVFTAETDKINTDPKLGSLADNGGSTPTLALLSGSPAVNAGSTLLGTDQRGLQRPQGAASDIGAFEQFFDATAPVSTISAPSQNQNLSLAAFNAISGNATDNIGVTQVLVKLFRTRNGVTTFWNGSSFGAAQVLLPATLTAPGDTSTGWSFAISSELKAALDSGAYSVVVYARDAQGNQSGAIGRNFNLVTDTVVPAAIISTPTQNQTLTVAAFSAITGSASDNVGVSQVLVKLFRTRSGVTTFWNGSSFGAAQVQLPANLSSPGATSTAWNFPVSTDLKSALDEGPYLLAVYARDAVGNQSSAVGRNFTLNNDVTAPVVSIATPSQNQSLSILAFGSVTGNATDAVGVTQVFIKLFRTRNGVTTFWNGTSFGAAQVLLPVALTAPGSTSTTWSFSVSPQLQAALDSGAYLLTAYGKDAAGNQSGAIGRNFTLTASGTLQAVRASNSPSGASF